MEGKRKSHGIFTGLGRKNHPRHLFNMALFLWMAVPAFGQESNERLSVFIDCQMRCDFTFVRQEVTFIDYIRERYEADIYVLATDQRTGSGGEEVQLVFQGNNGFSHLNDTIKYFVVPDATDVVHRNALVKNFKRGILPYLLETDHVGLIDYSINTDELSTPNVGTQNDPWNFWVFNIGGNVSLEGESRFSRSNIRTRFSASRVTDANKSYFTLRYNYEHNNFTLGDGEEIQSIIKNYYTWGRHVWSLNDHWSAGLLGYIGSSTFGNTDIEGYIRPALEYNIFPYSLVATKRFTFLYSVGPEYRDYTELTIFDKLSETIMRQSLVIEFQQTQKWGDLSIDVEARQFLHDLNLYSISIDPRIDWNVFRGLNVEFGGNVSWISDRINIAKSDFSDEDILLQIKQLDTSYSFSTYIGINYRFGSRYNNVVNPRF